MSAMKGKNVLVAGGSGLVGTNLVKKLHGMGAHVRATRFSKEPPLLPQLFEKRDFTEQEECVEATKDMDYVFICSAQTFGAKILHENPTAMVMPNLKINAGLLDACRLNKVDRVLWISSNTLYQEAWYPIREDELDLNKPVYELYRGVSWMKRYIEQLIGFYHARYNMKIGIARPANIYGPYDKFDPETAHVLPALINRALRKENPYVVWGFGNAVKDFVYVEDFVDGIINILERHANADAVNVTGAGPITVRKAVDIILKACDHNVTPVYDTTKPEAIPYRALSPIKYNALFGETPKVSFEEGIRRTVQWLSEVIKVGV